MSRIITFDLDGILINSHGLHDEAFIFALESLGMNAAALKYKELIEDEGALEAISTRGKLERLGAAAYYTQVKEAKDAHFYTLLPRVIVSPWLKVDLRRVKRELDAHIGIVTNCSEQMAYKLLELADIGPTDFPVFAPQPGEPTKPHPALYMRADAAFTAAARNRAPYDWVALEDSQHGIEAAKAAGVPTPILTTYQETQERLRLCAF